MDSKCDKSDPQNKEKGRHFMIKNLSGKLKDSYRALTSFFEGFKKKRMFFSIKKCLKLIIF